MLLNIFIDFMNTTPGWFTIIGVILFIGVIFAGNNPNDNYNY